MKLLLIILTALTLAGCMASERFAGNPQCEAAGKECRK